MLADLGCSLICDPFSPISFSTNNIAFRICSIYNVFDSLFAYGKLITLTFYGGNLNNNRLDHQKKNTVINILVDGKNLVN